MVRHVLDISRAVVPEDDGYYTAGSQDAVDLSGRCTWLRDAVMVCSGMWEGSRVEHLRTLC